MYRHVLTCGDILVQVLTMWLYLCCVARYFSSHTDRHTELHTDLHFDSYTDWFIWLVGLSGLEFSSHQSHYDVVCVSRVNFFFNPAYVHAYVRTHMFCLVVCVCPYVCVCVCQRLMIDRLLYDVFVFVLWLRILMCFRSVCLFWFIRPFWSGKRRRKKFTLKIFLVRLIRSAMNFVRRFGRFFCHVLVRS